MNTIRKEAAFDAASFCMRMKKEAAKGRPYGAAGDQTKRRGDLCVKRNMVYRSEGTWYTGFTILRWSD